MNKYLIGLIIACVIAGVLAYEKPSVNVTAEANATSTVIVPTSTRTIVPITTSTTSTVSRETPKTVIIYQTYETPVAGSMVDVVPVVNPTVEHKEAPITYVPTPVYTTVTPMPTPVNEPVVQPINEPVVASAPVIEPVIEPVNPTFTEWPRAWVEERYNGDWLFFEGKWDTGELGTVKCNGIFYDKAVKSGFASIIEAQFKELPAGTYVTCDFIVGTMGGTTLNYVTK